MDTNMTTRFIIFQPDNIEKVLKGTKTCTSRQQKYEDGVYHIDMATRVELKGFYYDSFKKMKNPEGYAKAEGFKSIKDMLENAKFKATKDFINGKRGLYVYTIKLLK